MSDGKDGGFIRSSTDASTTQTEHTPLSSAYRVLRVPRHETLRVRGLDMHLSRWGPEPAASPPIFLLHGWLDTGDTFQFVVDAFERELPLVALDWRGFGLSAWPQDGYWFPDYLADLDALLDRLSPGIPAVLVGHSMGGNIAALYAGLRPERVRCLVAYEGFGLPRTTPDQAPGRMRKWLNQVKSAPVLKDYESLDQLAATIHLRYPRFTAAQADFFARAWSARESGRVRLLGDARHRWVNPVLYKREDSEAIWREIKAPFLMVVGNESDYLTNLGSDGSEAALRAMIPHIDIARVEGAGHMLHIEKAEVVAALTEKFLRAH